MTNQRERERKRMIETLVLGSLLCFAQKTSSYRKTSLCVQNAINENIILYIEPDSI